MSHLLPARIGSRGCWKLVESFKLLEQAGSFILNAFVGEPFRVVRVVVPVDQVMSAVGLVD